MHLISVNSKGIGGILVSLFTFSKWNHSAIYFEDTGRVYDSTFFTGVRCTNIESYKQKYPRHDIYYIRVPDEDSAKKFAHEQLGKSYDWTALFGLVFRNSWEEPDSWFCSELAEATIKASGLTRFRDVVSKLVPKEIWAII